jgi:hypothetical protein
MPELHELQAWLGDDHGLNTEQLTELLATTRDIEVRYPDVDDEGERQAALVVAYQLLLGQTDVVDEMARKLHRARSDKSTALAGLRQAALMLIPAGEETQAGFARRANVDRMAVREWLGLRGSDRTRTS